MEEAKQQEQQNSGKVKKKFEDSLKKLEAVMRNPNWFKKDKIGISQLPEFLERLTLGKKEDLYKKFEAAAIKLIENKLIYDKTIKQKEQEFNKAVEDKMKEFQVEMDAMFAIIEQIDNITKDYYGALSSVAEGKLPVVMGNQTPGEDNQGEEKA